MFYILGELGGKLSNLRLGYRKGVPLLVQMILVTWLCTAFVGEKSGAKIYSYVDDWVLLFPNLEQAPVAVRHLKKLCDALGLILSLPKSNVFATSVAMARNLQGTLQSEGFVLGQAKNLIGLGVNFQTASQPTSQMREERWLKARVLLDRLQYMPWTQYRKAQVINRGILPLVFYGCNTWRAGKDFLREVRAKCNHSVWGKKQYHLHYLSPLFSGQQYEPVLYMAKHRFAALLRLFVRHETLVKQVWDQSINAKSYFKGKSRGCISLFQSQLNDLGWEMYAGGKCVTDQGWEFSIWEISSAQLWSWLKDPGNSRCYNIYS